MRPKKTPKRLTAGELSVRSKSEHLRFHTDQSEPKSKVPESIALILKTLQQERTFMKLKFKKILDRLMRLGFVFLLSSTTLAQPSGKGGGGKTSEPAYTSVRLGAVPGSAVAISDIGPSVGVVGYLELGSEQEIPVYWQLSPTGTNESTYVLESSIPEANAWATGINANHVIVGYEFNPISVQRDALLWPTPDSAPIVLPKPSGAYAYAMDINLDGTIIGGISISNVNYLAAWRVSVVDGSFTVSTGTLLHETTELLFPAAISDSGYVAYTACGTYGDVGLRRAFRTRLGCSGSEIFEEPGARTQLFNVYSEASCVNNAGTVGGQYSTSTGVGAFAMTLSGSLLNLPTLPPDRIQGVRGTYRNVNAIATTDENQFLCWSVRSVGWISPSVLTTPGGSAVNLETFEAEFTGYNLNGQAWICGARTNELGQFPTVLVPNN
jgi:hypothetical protein